MSMSQIIDVIRSDGGSWLVIVVIMMSIVQISPLKINPWDTLLKWLGSKFNQGINTSLTDLKDTIDGQSKDIQQLRNTVNENQAMTSRYRIIRFDDEMISGVVHSQDHIEQIIEDIRVYEIFCKSNPDFINHKGRSAMERILDRYENKQVM